ncbi:hypothetical protein V8E52_004802 [Russula decolorans]
MMITMIVTALVNESAAPTLSTGIASSRKPIPPSVTIVSMQGSNTTTTTRAGGGARREPVMDRTTTMRVKP